MGWACLKNEPVLLYIDKDENGLLNIIYLKIMLKLLVLSLLCIIYQHLNSGRFSTNFVLS